MGTREAGAFFVVPGGSDAIMGRGRRKRPHHPSTSPPPLRDMASISVGAGVDEVVGGGACAALAPPSDSPSTPCIYPISSAGSTYTTSSTPPIPTGARTTLHTSRLLKKSD